jgi:hypothetical protein
MTLVGTSIMDERAFVTMTFVQNCLGASLRTHLPLCVRMKLQEEYDEETFPCFVLQLASESIFLVMLLQVHFCRRRKAFGGEKKKFPDLLVSISKKETISGTYAK